MGSKIDEGTNIWSNLLKNLGPYRGLVCEPFNNSFPIKNSTPALPVWATVVIMQILTWYCLRSSAMFQAIKHKQTTHCQQLLPAHEEVSVSGRLGSGEGHTKEKGRQGVLIIWKPGIREEPDGAPLGRHPRQAAGSSRDDDALQEGQNKLNVLQGRLWPQPIFQSENWSWAFGGYRHGSLKKSLV